MSQWLDSPVSLSLSLRPALDILHSVMNGETTPVQAVEDAKKKWSCERANCGHAEKLLPGEAQAKEVEPEFLELVRTAVF